VVDVDPAQQVDMCSCQEEQCNAGPDQSVIETYTRAFEPPCLAACPAAYPVHAAVPPFFADKAGSQLLSEAHTHAPLAAFWPVQDMDESDEAKPPAAATMAALKRSAKCGPRRTVSQHSKQAGRQLAW